MTRFPFFSDEESMIIAGFLAGDASPEDLQTIEKLRAESEMMMRFIDDSAGRFDEWLKSGRDIEFSDRVRAELKAAGHQEFLRKAWKRIDLVSNKLRDEFELVFESFFPSLFDSGSGYLGQLKHDGFRIQFPVSPFLGLMWNSDSINIVPPEGGVDFEIEVRDEGGAVILVDKFEAPVERSYPVANMSLLQGDSCQWTFTYFEDGEIEVMQGEIVIPSNTELENINRMLEFVQAEGEGAGIALLEGMIYMEVECYETCLNHLYRIIDEAENLDDRREFTVLLHRCYCRIRNYYERLGWEQESNEMLGLIFAVEEELRKLTSLEEVTV